MTWETWVKESRTDSCRGLSCSWAAWTFSCSFRLSSCRARSSSRAWTSSSSYWQIFCSCSSCSDCSDEIWKDVSVCEAAQDRRHFWFQRRMFPLKRIRISKTFSWDDLQTVNRTSCVSWLVCCRMRLSCSSKVFFCWSSSSKASWTFWRWDCSRWSFSVSFATSSWRSWHPSRDQKINWCSFSARNITDGIGIVCDRPTQSNAQLLSGRKIISFF